MMGSMMLGVVVATILPPINRVAAVVRGMAVGLVVWAVMEYVVLSLADEVAYEGFVDWTFAVGHVLFGAMVGLIAAEPAFESEGVVRIAEPA